MLSIVVSTLLLPIYALADRWREKEKEHQRKMSSDIQVIKKHYHGVERYYSIRAAYRIYGYSPLFSLRTAFGFLIQIPFFFAAYQLLSHYTAYQGIHFGIIRDLGSPDGIVYGINILPFFMTVINIITGFFYIKEWNRNELFQLFGLSLFFLIVLYNSASGLVLYWTANNCFSLAKYVYINRKYLSERISQSLRLIVQICSGVIMINTIKIFLFLGGYFLIHYILHFDRSSVSAQYSLYTVIWILTICYICICVYIVSNQGMKKILQLHILLSLVLFIVSLIVSIYLLRQLHTVSLPKDMGLYSVTLFNHSVTINNIAQIATALLLMSIVFCIYAVIRNNMSIHIISKIDYTIKLFAFILVCFIFITVIAIPLILYVTAPEDLGGNIVLLLRYILLLAVLAYIILFVIGYVSYRFSTRLFHIVTTIISFFTIISLFYGFILNINIGVLRGQRFSNDDILFTVHVLTNLFEVVAIFSLVYVVYYYLNIYKKYLVIFLSITCILWSITITQLVVKHSSIDSGISSKNIDEKTLLPEYHNTIVSFSKEKNILYIILDAFAADIFEDVLAKYPHLYTGLDGFYWYKNTVSISEQTYHSMSAMIAGYNYAPDNIAKFNRSMDENIYQLRFYWSKKLPDYNISYVNGFWFDAERLNKLDNVTAVITSQDDYIHYYRKNFLQIQPIIELWEKFKKILDIYKITSISLFKMAPFHIKQRIYSKPGDVFSSKYALLEDQKFFSSRYADRYLYYSAFFNTIATTSNTNSPHPTFKLLWSSAHMPYFLEDNCISIAPEIISGTNTDRYSPKHGPAQLKCALDTMITWIQWMKKENIYDITKIVIASDHGSSSFFSSNDKNDPYAKEGDIFALLMVKDFGERGNLRISQRLMSNADIPSIIASGIPEHSFPELQLDPIKTKREGVAMKHHVVHSDYNLELTEFKHKYMIIVQDDVYDKENWIYRYFDE